MAGVRGARDLNVNLSYEPYLVLDLPLSSICLFRVTLFFWGISIRVPEAHTYVSYSGDISFAEEEHSQKIITAEKLTDSVVAWRSPPRQQRLHLTKTPSYQYVNRDGNAYSEHEVNMKHKLTHRLSAECLC